MSAARRRRPAERRADGSATADYGKTASFLAIGVGLTGVITYVYFLIASHVLSKPDYGQITVLWSAVFITISTLYRPVEQLLSRHISEHLVKGESIGQPMRVAATIQLGLALIFAVARAGPARADPGRPARGQRNALLGLLLGGPLLRGELLRPRLPRRRAALRPLHRADPLRVGLPHPLRRAGRGQPAQRPVRGRDRDRRRARRSACWSSRSPSPGGRKQQAGRAPPAARRATEDASSRWPTAAASPPRCW